MTSTSSKTAHLDQHNSVIHDLGLWSQSRAMVTLWHRRLASESRILLSFFENWWSVLNIDSVYPKSPLSLWQTLIVLFNLNSLVISKGPPSPSWVQGTMQVVARGFSPNAGTRHRIPAKPEPLGFCCDKKMLHLRFEFPKHEKDVVRGPGVRRGGSFQIQWRKQPCYRPAKG